MASSPEQLALCQKAAGNARLLEELGQRKECQKHAHWRGLSLLERRGLGRMDATVPQELSPPNQPGPSSQRFLQLLSAFPWINFFEGFFRQRQASNVSPRPGSFSSPAAKVRHRRRQRSGRHGSFDVTPMFWNVHPRTLRNLWGAKAAAPQSLCSFCSLDKFQLKK